MRLKKSSILYNFSQIKISSWNVNGLRSVINKQMLQSYVQHYQPDILCMNETRIDQFLYQKVGVKQICPNTHHYLNECKVKKGYSGVGVITKIKPINVYYDFQYLKLGQKYKPYQEEGRVITLEYQKFYLINTYKPNAGDNLKRLDYRMVFDDLFNEYIQQLNKIKPTVIVGDFNVAPKPIDLTYPQKNLRNAGFTIQQRALFQNLTNIGMIDGFRHFYPSKIQYTWWNVRQSSTRRDAIGWRIDHILFPPKLLDSVVKVTIEEQVYGSDHCPISTVIDLNKIKESQN